jgi:lysophospholipase L1-like esterase
MPHNNKQSVIRIGLLGLSLYALAALPAAYAQPRMTPVPDVVRMERPTATEIEQVTRSFDNYRESLDATTRAILDKHPTLLAVRTPGFNSAIMPNLSINFLPQHQAQVEIAKRGDIDVLFTGDSITDWWDSEREPFAGKAVFDKYFGSWKIANFGIAGDTTQGLLYRLQNGEGQGFSPKAVMLLIGVNNTRSNSPGEIAEGIGAVVLQLQQNFPAAKILLLGIFPSQQAGSPLRRDIAYINDKISQLHDGDKVHYLDISDVFLDAAGNIPAELMSDALHPTTKGYELWAEAVIGPLTSLLGR